MQFLIFLDEVGAILCVFGFVAGGDQLLGVSAEDDEQLLFVVLLSSGEERCAGRLGGGKRFLAVLWLWLWLCLRGDRERCDEKDR
jgi:hypothetical protein